MRSENSNKFEGQKLALLIFEGVMAVFYLIFAVVFLFPSLFHLRLAVQDGLRIALGIILSLYGIFRIYRTIKKML